MEANQSRWQYFHQRLRKNMDAACGGRKDAIDVLRTAFWFAEIKVRLGVPSAYMVERRLEIDAFGKNKDGDIFHRNKWPKYEVGQHVPSDALVTMVEGKLPGTKRLLNHALWKALQRNFDVSKSYDDWLRQLAPDIQKIVFQEDSRNPGNGSRRNSLSRRQLRMLERRAGIDVLACLTIFAREAVSQGTQAKIFDLGTSLYRVLLILCTTIPIGDFALELFDTYRERVLSLIRHEGLEFQLDDSEFVSAIGLLRSRLLALEDNDHIGVWPKDSIQAMSKILDGGYGFDIKFALAPLIGPTGPITKANAKAFADLERQKRFREWGKRQVFSRNRQVLPPPELW